MISINIDKAKEITKDRLRNEREEAMKLLDIEFMKNISNPDKLVEIEAQKQILRDITSKVDNLNNLDELKSLKVGK